MIAVKRLPALRPLLPMALIGGLWLCLMCAGLLIQPPAVRSHNVPTQFDAASARQRLVRILGDEAPHPVDSEAQDRVRDRLLGEIRALGIEPQVKHAFACRPFRWGSAVGCAMTRNIVFSIGPGSGPSVLAATHYDSVPAGPGASDAGIGIASWLEIAKVLSHEKLKRRIIFLISDGEESGLLGAQAFGADPRMKDVRALINLEARGTRGPAVFFETNRPNANAVRAFAASAERPLANSIMADVYRLLPNSTDVTALKRDGLDVINIALLDGVENYHTPRDSLQSFNSRSLQHMGDIALGAARTLAGQTRKGSKTSLAFTDILSRVFIAFPEWAGRLALLLGAIIAFGVFWKEGAGRRGRAAAAPVAALIFALVLSGGLGALLSSLRPGEYWFAYPQVSRAWCALSALFGVTLSLFWLARGVSARAMQAASLFCFSSLGFLGSFVLPGLSSLLFVPSLLFCVGALLALRWPEAFRWSSIVAAFMAVLIWAPSIFLAELALGFELPFALAGLAAIMLLPWMGILVRVQRDAPWKPLAISEGAALAASVGLALLLPSASNARPQPLNLTYFLDVTKNEARFIAGPARLRLPAAMRGAGQFTPAFMLPGDRAQSWSAPAPLVSLPAPRLEIISDQQSSAGRIVRARLQSDGAYRIAIRIPRAAQPVKALVEGVEAPLNAVISRDAFVALACQGRACDGAEIVFYFRPGLKAHEWSVIGQYFGLPAVARDLVQKRPKSATAIQFGDGVTTLRRQ